MSVSTALKAAGTSHCKDTLSKNNTAANGTDKPAQQDNNVVDDTNKPEDNEDNFPGTLDSEDESPTGSKVIGRNDPPNSTYSD